MYLFASLETISTITIAVALCNGSVLKECLDHKVQWETKNNKRLYRLGECCWKDFIKRKMVSHYSSDERPLSPLPQSLFEHVMQLMSPIFQEMLSWCRYHFIKYDLPPSVTVKVLNEAMFTCRGKLNNTKAIKN